MSSTGSRSVITVAAAALLAGCGSSSAPPVPTAPPVATTAAVAAAPTGDLKPVTDALRSVRSYHVDGIQTGTDGPLRIVGDFSAAHGGTARVKLKTSRYAVEIRVIRSHAYVKGDLAYWVNASHDPGVAGAVVARALSGRWVTSKAGDKRVTGLVEAFRPSAFAKCLGPLPNSPFVAAGSATQQGRQVRVLRDAGTNPGDAPGVMYVAASGRPLPLRVVQSAAIRPGGPAHNRCSDADTQRSDVRFSRYDAPISVPVPSGARPATALVKGFAGRI